MTNEPDFDFDELDAIAAGAGTAVATEASEPSEALADSTPATRSRNALPPLYFDLETIPDYDRMESFGLEPLPDVLPETPADALPEIDKLIAGTVPQIKTALGGINPCDEWLQTVARTEAGNKNRDGVFDAIKAARGWRDARKNAEADRRKLMSTTPEFCRIVAIGAVRGNNETGSWVVGQKHPSFDRPIDEFDILNSFWAAAAEVSQFIGFNIAAFDLPVILVRSALLGIQPTRFINLSPYGNDVCDLMAVRWRAKMAKPMRLKALAKAMGIEVPAGDTDGGDVERLWKEEPGKLCEYVESDVTITRELHRKYQGYFCL